MTGGSGEKLFALAVRPTPPGRALDDHEALLPLILHERATLVMRLAFLY